MHPHLSRCTWIGNLRRLLAMAALTLLLKPALAADYVVTLGGGYIREGNQASLEANVLFVQELFSDSAATPVQHFVYFADGESPEADLQVMADPKQFVPPPVTELLSQLHRRRGISRVAYRNHRVPKLAGSLDPVAIRERFESLGKTLTADDRLIVYVTAHGSAGERQDPFNTTLDCWNNTKISAREFTQWLDALPKESDVIMVMAQCYCGGFSHTLFQDFDPERGLAIQLRAGFFAQQHNLPAAGCRPDIEYDQEFSSYFWGAFAGRSRNGVPITGCDLDRDGRISFAEAHAYAVFASETIDIPLKSSEVLLKTFSQLEKPESSESDSIDPPESPETSQPSDTVKSEEWFAPTGTLQRFVELGGPVSGATVGKLAELLELDLKTDVAEVRRQYQQSRRGGWDRGRSRGPGGGVGRRGSGRRALLAEISEQWPELGDSSNWMKSDLLKPEKQQELLEQIQALPSWPVYKERRQQMEAAEQEATERELRSVKLRRLLQTIESITLAKNLPLVATEDVQTHYRRLMELENSSLRSQPSEPQKSL